MTQRVSGMFMSFMDFNYFAANVGPNWHNPDQNEDTLHLCVVF